VKFIEGRTGHRPNSWTREGKEEEIWTGSNLISWKPWQGPRIQGLTDTVSERNKITVIYIRSKDSFVPGAQWCRRKTLRLGVIMGKWSVKTFSSGSRTESFPACFSTLLWLYRSKENNKPPGKYVKKLCISCGGIYVWLIFNKRKRLVWLHWRAKSTRKNLLYRKGFQCPRSHSDNVVNCVWF
jgi:hypothetical protein